jgi:hypothetical protein
LPVLEVSEDASGLAFEWRNIGDIEFPMPIPVRVNGRIRRVEFTGNRAVLPGIRQADVQVDPFMQVLRKLPIVPTCEERREEAAEP